MQSCIHKHSPDEIHAQHFSPIKIAVCIVSFLLFSFSLFYRTGERFNSVIMCECVCLLWHSICHFIVDCSRFSMFLMGFVVHFAVLSKNIAFNIMFCTLHFPRGNSLMNTDEYSAHSQHFSLILEKKWNK